MNSNALIKTIKSLVTNENSSAHYTFITSYPRRETADTQESVIYLGLSNGNLAECLISKNKMIPEASLCKIRN